MVGSWSSEDLFQFFVVQQQQLAMMQMGKILHPATGKIERDLEGARFSIDLLGMLEEKTRGNLSEEETRLLGQILTNLRLNYLEEARRPASEEPAAAGEQQTEGPGAAPGEAAPDRETATDEGAPAAGASPQSGPEEGPKTAAS